MSSLTNDEQCDTESPMQEEWREIAGYEGLYEVSDAGRVKSFKRSTPKILKPNINPSGYPKVTFWKKGKESKKYVHRLVAGAFLLDFTKDLLVDHRNGDKLINNLSNLRMVNPSGNHLGFRRNGKGSSSQFRGVSWNENARKWLVRANLHGKDYYIGIFQNEDEAAKAWNKKATELGYFPESLNKV